MHLRYDWIPKTYNDYRASPDAWVVTDDYGTRFDALRDPEPSERTDQTYLKRVRVLSQEDADPDFFRWYWTRPDWHQIAEAMAFSSPIGLSIELGLKINFLVHPHWDEQAGDAYFTRDRGARIEILYLNACIFEDSTQPVALDPAALEEFCWQHIELKRVREAAESRTAAAEVPA